MQTAAYTEKELVEVAGILAGRSGLKHQDREDCQQEVALAMLIAERKADPSGNVKAYQHVTGRGIALNTFNRTFDHNRRNITLLHRVIDDVDGEPVTYADITPARCESPFDSQVSTERTQAIDKAINSLPEREATVIRAHLLNGETLTVIGKANGFSVQYAHQILNSGKAKLASQLAEWK